jgi:hypothetical protein
MKTTPFISRLTKMIFGSIAVAAIFSLSSCAKKIAFLSSEVVPAAQGTVKVKTDDNKNHAIEIEIFNLAEPQRLQPPKQLYIVWMLTDQDLTKNIGQIKTSTSTFSKNLKATFETVTSFRPVKIFITAEDDANVQNPSWEIVLTTNQFQR